MPPTDPSHALPAPSASVVLVVSADETLVARIRATMAPDRGLAVHASPSIGDAEIEALELHPTVVVLDLDLRGRTPALDLIRRLRNRTETAALPVLALGSAGESQLRAAVFDAGASDYVEKMPDPIELRARIRGLSDGFNVLEERNEALAAMGRLQRQLRDAVRDADEARSAARPADAAPQEARTWQSRVESITRLGMELSRIHDFHLLMERILSEARGLTGADAGTIYTREGDSLRFAFSQNDTLEAPGRHSSTRFSSLVVPVSPRSIAGYCAMTGASVNVADAYAMEPGAPYQFDRSYDAMTGYRTNSVVAVPMRDSSDVVLGVLQLLNARGPEEGVPGRFGAVDERLAEHFASMATVVLERAQVTERVILRMIRMAEVRDPAETGPHIERVAGYSCVLFDEWARRRGFTGPGFERQRDRLRIAAKLHDVGKIGISDVILKKPGRLDADELRQMQQHTVIGARLFADSPTQFDETAREVVLNHHERWDGMGYPGHVDLDGRPIVDPATGVVRTGGKRGEEIPLFARIVCIADVFDALTSRRAYKEAWSEDQALEYVRAERGRQFDPGLVDILLSQLDALRAVRAAHAGD